MTALGHLVGRSHGARRGGARDHRCHQHVSNRIPGSIVALCLGTIAVAVLELDVETIGTRFGGIPAGLPRFHFPTFRLELAGALFVPALTVAMLGAIESLMSAMVADRINGERQ